MDPQWTVEQLSLEDLVLAYMAADRTGGAAMIWFTWRQFRTQTWIALGALAVLGVLLVFAAGQIADLYAASGLADCQAHCDSQVHTFLRSIQGGIGGVGYFLGLGLTYAVPPLIGAFWGAPLIARELETGTIRLAWNQSVTRNRWLATKLIGVGGLSVATAGLLSLGTTWAASTVDRVGYARISPLVFGARGIVPVGVRRVRVPARRRVGPGHPPYRARHGGDARRLRRPRSR